MSTPPPSLAEWLTARLREPATYESFETVDATEREVCSDGHRDHLARLLQASALDPDFVRDLSRLAGWDAALAALESRLPAQPRARRGRFGEVLAAAALNEFDGYVVPVEKARYVVTGGQSQPATDALALRIDTIGEVSEVCFVEVKLRTTADMAAPMEGARQLAADYAKKIPDIVTFAAARLHERSDPLYEPFMRYFASREADLRDTFCLTAVYDTCHWRETALTNLDDDQQEIAPLRVVAMRLAELRALVDDVFERAGLIADDD
jgi:hypothetical protein